MSLIYSLVILFMFLENGGRKARLTNEPNPGWVKLNVDGCVWPNSNKGATGGVLRDEVGNWKWGFSAILQSPTVNEADLKALKLGLMEAWERRYDEKIEVETDFQLVFNLLTEDGEERQDPNIQLLAVECRDLLKKPWTVEFRWIERYANSVADKLAKIANSV